MIYLVLIAAGYASGSVLFAYLLPRCICHTDITRQGGDGNPGTANAFAYAGIPIGTAVILLELAKGFVPVFIAARVTDTACWPFALVLLAPVLGHAFPWWRPRGGGKAIAVSFGVLLGLLPHYYVPLAVLVLLYLFFSLAIRIQPHVYRSVATYACFGILCLVLVPVRPVAAGCILVSAVVLVKHLLHFQGERLSICILPLIKGGQDRDRIRPL